MSELLIFTGLLVILAIGGLISDYILPRIKPINRFIDHLPMMRDNGNEWNAEIVREERAA